MYKRVVNTKSGTIEYMIVGNGKPVLVLHGGHSNCYERLALSGFDTLKYQFIIPSRPGYGKTPLGHHHTPEQAALLIATLLNQLGLPKVVVYAVSAGGLTGIALASLYPHQVDKLILVSAVSKKWLHPKGRIYRTARIIFHPFLQGLTWRLTRLMFSLRPEATARAFFVQFSTSMVYSLHRDDVKCLHSALNHYRSGRGFLNDIDQELKSGILRVVNCPTLLIHSRNDNAVPYDHMLYAHQLINNSELISLENDWGHMVWLGTGRKELVRHISKFISAKSDLSSKGQY